MNFYHWVIENITDFFYKKRTKIYIKEEEQEGNMETKIDPPQFSIFYWGKTKRTCCLVA